MTRGVDGLTIEELHSSREFWDGPYTRALLDAIPMSARTLLDVGCGLGRAARELLPHRDALAYTGIDVDAARLAHARRDPAATAVAARTRWLRAAAEQLPFRDGAADVVLLALMLHHVADPAVVLREARRVLGPEGAVVSIEPDYTAQRMYFDGPLPALDAAFAALRADCQAAQRPADHNVGPRVPSLLRAAGFREVTARVHALQGGGVLPAQAVAADLHHMTDTLAAIAGGPGVAADACRRAIDHWLAAVGPETAGDFRWFVPVFVASGARPARA